MKIMTPENHINFKALSLCNRIDNEIKDCAVAFIEPNGGGPSPDHIHDHDHLFTIISGEVEIRIEDKKYSLSEGKSIRVSGNKLHSVWNKGKITAKVMGISLNK